jgi:hypothetical protein
MKGKDINSLPFSFELQISCNCKSSPGSSLNLNNENYFEKQLLRQDVSFHTFGYWIIVIKIFLRADVISQYSILSNFLLFKIVRILGINKINKILYI